MDEAAHIKEDSRTFFMPAALAVLLTAVSLVLYQALASKLSLVLGLGLAGLLAVWTLPMKQSILFFYLYLFLDGAIKILSNYHPLFHVAQDLIVISLCARSVMSRDLGGFAKFARTPFLPLLFVFILWVLIQFVNPFGLGLLPSIAGTKVYVSSIFVFLLTYHHFGRKDLEQALTWLTFLGLAEGLLATVEYLFFQGFVFRLHPRYAEIAGNMFVGDLFRPFGTTSAPGAPSMWIFLTAGIAMYLVSHAHSKLARGIGVAHLLVSLPTLFFCQTRAAILLSALGVALVLLCPHRGIWKRLAGLFLLGGGLALTAGTLSARLGADGHAPLLSKTESKVLSDRLFSLTEKSTLENSRAGSESAISRLASKSVLGIGLSRVGAASAVWDARIDADPYFDRRWSFADNLYVAIFTELGVFGSLFWLALILIPSLYLLRVSFERRRTDSAPLLWLCGTYCVILLVGGFGSEGVLYNPSSGFLWLMIGVGLREVQREPA